MMVAALWQAPLSRFPSLNVLLLPERVWCHAGSKAHVLTHRAVIIIFHLPAISRNPLTFQTRYFDRHHAAKASAAREQVFCCKSHFMFQILGRPSNTLHIAGSHILAPLLLLVLPSRRSSNHPASTTSQRCNNRISDTIDCHECRPFSLRRHSNSICARSVCPES